MRSGRVKNERTCLTVCFTGGRKERNQRRKEGGKKRGKEGGSDGKGREKEGKRRQDTLRSKDVHKELSK